MKKTIKTLLLILTLLAIPFNYYAAINTLVSIKYETDLGECISKISGIDLCLQYDIFISITYSCAFLTLILFLIRILNTIKR